ncbi:MAG: alanine:cation symporter family protein, partial [Acidobacteriota bacterium]
PVMAAIYVTGAMVILVMNAGEIFPTLGLIVSEAFNPTAGVAGGGVGAFLVTLMWGVKRGLFSNEAGQGSAPIAHAAAKTDEPVSEGVVALLEPFIDTLVICTMTGLVILITGVATEKVETPIEIGGDIAWVTVDDKGMVAFVDAPGAVEFRDGVQVAPQDVQLGWHEAAVGKLFLDKAMTQTFTGTVDPEAGTFTAADGTVYQSLTGTAVENGAPLTRLAFERGLPGTWGGYIVIFSVLLFGISTAISWNYYGDRCANYIWGAGAILPFKAIFIGFHFLGAVVNLNDIWAFGDVALGLVTFPNLIALILLSGQVKSMTNDYFDRKPWEQQANRK